MASNTKNSAKELLAKGLSKKQVQRLTYKDSNSAIITEITSSKKPELVIRRLKRDNII